MNFLVNENIFNYLPEYYFLSSSSVFDRNNDCDQIVGIVLL